MADWPGSVGYIEPMVLQSSGLQSAAGQYLAATNTADAGSVWTTANRAMYIPVQVQTTCTVFKMSYLVVTQSGNYDIGIYDESGNRLVSLGSTAVPVAGIATADIADTTLTPGTYFLALNFDNTTVSVTRKTTGLADLNRSLGIQEQAVGAVTLPNPATFATPTFAFIPLISAHLTATV
jgi:hypothetical protein